MTTASPEDQRRLLDLQALDTRLDQLAHRRRTLPAALRVQELEAQLADLNGSLVASRTAASDLRRELAKAEGDVQQVRDRAQRDRTLVESGAVGAKETQGLMSELETLARRQDALEEIELEVMERLEAHTTTLERLEEANAELLAAKAQAEEERDRGFAELDAESGRVSAERESLRAGVSESAVALYERLRGRLGGVAVAALRHGRSEGSGLPVSPIELARIKALPPEEVVFCEDSGRILVRSEDSFS